MKIAIYTIAKNERKFVDRFMQSTAGADYVIVLDTGSTDGTVERLQELGATVYQEIIEPFRFDVARNKSLDYVPHDATVCVSIDLDETLQDGWREAIEQVWTDDTKQLTYLYVWDHRADGSPGTQFWYEKIHARYGFKWVYPIHEVLDPNNVEKIRADVVVHHYPDLTKPRGDYLRLLLLSVEEDPNNDRHVHYLARELMYHERWQEAIHWFAKHLTMSSSEWAPERAASYRYMASCWFKQGNIAMEEVCLLRACSEAPGEREPWIDHAKYCIRTKQWAGGLYSAQRALAIVEKPEHYICDGYAWAEGPFDIMSVCYYYLGLKQQAFSYSEMALGLAPYSERLRSNHALIAEVLEA